MRGRDLKIRIDHYVDRVSLLLGVPWYTDNRSVIRDPSVSLNKSLNNDEKGP